VILCFELIHQTGRNSQIDYIISNKDLQGETSLKFNSPVCIRFKPFSMLSDIIPFKFTWIFLLEPVFKENTPAELFGSNPHPDHSADFMDACNAINIQAGIA